ncbi:MAG: hypothetical protein ACE5OZ_25380, partial [Candidatus Heimdallarchaeota archaeon]
FMIASRLEDADIEGDEKRQLEDFLENLSKIHPRKIPREKLEAMDRLSEASFLSYWKDEKPNISNLGNYPTNHLPD